MTVAVDAAVGNPRPWDHRAGPEFTAIAFPKLARGELGHQSGTGGLNLARSPAAATNQPTTTTRRRSEDVSSPPFRK